MPKSSQLGGNFSMIDKTERFFWQNFRCWQQWMKFWLTTLGLFSVIETDPPSPDEEEPAYSAALQRFKQRDYL